MNNTESSAASPMQAAATIASTSKVPLAIKLLYSAFVAVLVPVYWHNYGPTNFLYFCDIALLLTLVGLWTESSLLISMCSVGIVFPQILWLVDFGVQLVHRHSGMTSYMFNPELPLFTRSLSFFHGWLPLLLLWMLARLGYDKRALPAWSLLATALVVVSYFFFPAAGTVLPNPKIPVNIDYVYGFDDAHPQHWMNQNLYVVFWIAALFLIVFVPTHLALRKIYRPAEVN